MKNQAKNNNSNSNTYSNSNSNGKFLFVYLSDCLFIRLLDSYYHYHAFGEIKIYTVNHKKT